MATAARHQGGDLMADLNTTPLIDVMLVLLVMFIITIPVATNSIELELPQGKIRPTIGTVSNTVSIATSGQVYWNDSPASDAELRSALAATLALPVEPELRFQPAPAAGYGRAAEVLAQIKAAGVTRIGFVGNEQFAAFDKASK